MRLLLDTHSLLWFIGGNPSLSNHAKNLIEDPKNKKYYSHVNVWEIAIKVSLDKLKLPIPFEILFSSKMEENGFDFLPFSNHHFYQLIKLPYHHRDPFDRLLIAQACAEDFTLLTTDHHFLSYDVKTLW